MSRVTEETRKEAAATLSPWDVVLWKLDSLDKHVEAMDQGLNRRIDRVEERMDRLEQRMDRDIGGLRGEIGNVRTEIGGLRGEIGNVRTEIGGLRGEIRQELRGTRVSFTILELTAVLGFLAVLASIWFR